jgi:hypothetical protein
MTVETTQQDNASKGTNLLKAGGKLLGEVALTPGASLLLDGEIKSGVGHVISGLVARVLLGVPGVLLVAANSYATSITGESLLQNITAKLK